MRAMTLHQPWATGMALGFKRFETRGRRVKHRGLLAIHAGLQCDGDACLRLQVPDHVDLPRGVVLGVVTLVAVFEMRDDPALLAKPGAAFDITTVNKLERAWGDWRPGRWAYECKPVVWFREPIPARGMQGLWNWQEPANWRAL